MRCGICKKKFNVITNTHVSIHGISLQQYQQRFPYHRIGFSVSIAQLSKSDPRYKRWRESLKKRPDPWSKGYTKETHPSIAKISATFREKRIDNFAAWREKAKARGLIPSEYPQFKRNENLAFLIGMVLGDGNIFSYPRTEGLRIALGTDKPLLWQYTARVMGKVFKKEPHVYKVKNSNCVTLTIYQKQISTRLGVPAGNRGAISITPPQWIWENNTFLISYLRGLYEAEGSFNIHKPTSTYKIIFNNKNESLLNIVFDALQRLEFHPHRSRYKIQISKKHEVYAFKNLIKFRIYT